MASIFKNRKISLNLLDLLGGADVTADGMAEAFFGIAAVFARLEASRISERIRDAKHVQRNAGEFLGGSVPFGYTKRGGKLRPVPMEQNAIKYIRKIRAKHSLREIAEDLVPRRFPGLRKISHTTVAEVLKRPR